jgi:hypothetical protein
LPKRLPPLLLAVTLFTIYLLTLAPGLTWANLGADGGDLITAAATGGIPHPTGYPLYLLLARLFQWLPIGSLAYRTNLMSAVFAVGAAVLVYFIVRRETSWLPALAAGYAAGLAPLLWSQAVITEVYALQAFLVALVIYLSSAAWSAASEKRTDTLRGAVLGLAMGNHLTTLLLVPAALLITAGRRGDAGHWSLDRGSLGRQVLGFFAGCLVYLILPLRALSNPPVNWGDPVTPAGFWWLVSGNLYQGLLFSTPFVDLGDRLSAWAALLLHQFGLAGVLLAVLGLVIFFRPSRLYLLTIWTAAVFTVFSLGFSPSDSYLYLLPALLCFAIWIGFGTAGVLQLARRQSPALAWATALGVLLLFGALAWEHWPDVDASHDLRAEAFGSYVMTNAPRDAVLYASGDQAVFTLWYFHFALGQRPDLSIVAPDLLGNDWYEQDLHALYPSLEISPLITSFRQANPSRPSCSVQYTTETLFDCLPATAPAPGSCDCGD